MNMIEQIGNEIIYQSKHYGPDNQKIEQWLARIALNAMRSPTEAMKQAVLDAGGPQALAYALAAWPTMIDAALKEEA
jgi:hypothetical protein